MQDLRILKCTLSNGPLLAESVCDKGLLLGCFT